MEFFFIHQLSISLLCQRGVQNKCLHASATVVQRHRPSHVVEAAPGRVPTLDPHGQAVPETVPASSAFPERLFSSVGLVKRDLWGSLWTPPSLTWCGLNKHPKFNLKKSNRKFTITHTHPHIYTLHGTLQYICNWHTPIYVTDTH